MPSKQQADAVAEIAMTLTERPVPTAVEILWALNRAYQAGYGHGLVAGSQHTALVVDRVLEGFDHADS